MSTEWDEVKYEVAVANRVLAELGLATGFRASLGHASMRVPSDPERFIVKGRGYEVDVLSAMTPEQMVVCDSEGAKVDGPPGSRPCGEVKMHSCVYKTHPEVQSVVHVHPYFTVLATVLLKNIVPMSQEGMHLVREPLPVWPHAKTIQSDADGMAVAALLGDHKAVLLKGHGATTVGGSLQEAVMNMIRLEEKAKMNYYAYSAAGPDHPQIEDELVGETSYPPPLRHGGVWQYYTRLVSATLTDGVETGRE